MFYGRISVTSRYENKTVIGLLSIGAITIPFRSFNDLHKQRRQLVTALNLLGDLTKEEFGYVEACLCQDKFKLHQTARIEECFDVE